MKTAKEKTFKKQNNIILRIVKDLLGGIVISTILCILLAMLYDKIVAKWSAIGSLDITVLNNQELFFTELSLVFLVISFVTLLANKSETVFWVDVIQYRLVKPNHTSIVDISSYIFANLIISLIAFLFPAASQLALFSFVLTIILLGFLSIKLLMSFFGIDALKEDLEAEYRVALEFRKAVCDLYYDHDVLYTTTWRFEPLETFGSNINIHRKDRDMEHIYEKVMSKEFRKDSNSIFGTWKLMLKYFNLKYLFSRKLMLKYFKVKYVYSRKFEHNINACLDMRDNLYTNTMKSIEEHRINDISEQILFLLRYHEYEHALSCMKLAAEQCPIAFLNVFNHPRCHLSETCADALNQQLIALKKHPEYPILKENKGIENAYSKLASASINLCTLEMLHRQFLQTLLENDAIGSGIMYEALHLKHAILSVQKDKSTPSWSAKELFVLAFEQKKFDAAYHMLKRHLVFLENFNSGEKFPFKLLACMFKISQNSLDDISTVYELAEQAFRCKHMSQTTFLEFIVLIGSCYDILCKPISDFTRELKEKYRTEIIIPYLSIMAEKGIDIKSAQGLGNWESAFWLCVNAEQSKGV